ncbi:MAG: stage II sporulation protein P [Oscillospiraceae bacterium]|nr:stage II sporulation protein P [Oscillospiraceae bacterium]
MKEYRRARRVGLCAVFSALLLRLWTAGVPEALASQLVQVHIPAFLRYLETGRDVRFSSSSEVFSPDFVESPPPFLPEAEEMPPPPLPSFTGEEEVEIYYGVKKTVDLPALLRSPLTWQLRREEPTVLILHTHATESYTKNGEAYTETSRWRTKDENYNMLSIGSRVGELLAENGITAIQDRTLHDYPSYNGSYSHARKSITQYLEEYPTIALVLDLHRDASGEGAKQLRTKAQINGTDSAQLMLVMGVNPKNFEKNLEFSLKLHVQLENLYPGITRPLQFRAARYNQDLAPAAVLVEVGAAGNTHAEALTAAEALAQAIVALADGTQ